MKTLMTGICLVFTLGLGVANAEPAEMEAMMVDLTGLCGSKSMMSCISVAPGGACSQETNGVCVSRGPEDTDDLTKGLLCNCETRPKPKEGEQQSSF